MMNVKLIVVCLTLIAGSRHVQGAKDWEKFVSKPMNAENYKEIIKSKHFVFVKFFASWFVLFVAFFDIWIDFVKFYRCRYSRQMFEEWENLGEHYFDHDEVTIAEIDCSIPASKKICLKFGVDHYPRMHMFENGIFNDDYYPNKRNTKSFINYVEEFLNGSNVERDET